MATVSVDINILPAHYRPRVISFKQILTGLALVALVGGLLPVYWAWTQASAQTAARQVELARLKAALTQARLDREQLETIQKQIDQTRAEIERLQAESRQFGIDQSPRAAGVAIAVASLVPRVNIAAITQNASTYTITGQAGSQALVLDYARALQASAGFARVRIVSMVDTDPLGIAPDVRFEIELIR